MKFPNRSLRVGGACLFGLFCILIAGCGGSQNGENRQLAPAVTIRWTPSGSAIAGYNVYRASPPEVPIKINDEVVRDPAYTDKAVEAGRAYSYFVTSVDTKGLESAPSQRIDVRVPKQGIAAAFARYFAGLRDAPSERPK